LLSNPKDAANVRLNLAHEAQAEVLVASYVFKMDRAGLTTLAELRAAAKKGKRAVLIVDDFASRIPKKMLSYLVSEGVEVYQYHRFDWTQPLQYLRRFHSKLVVVDGKHLVSGDRNVANEYFGLDERSYVGCDVYVEGKAAQDAKAHIEELIKSDEVKKLKASSVSPSEYQAQKEILDRNDSKKLTQLLREDSSWKKKLIDSDVVEFYHDPVGKKGMAPGVDQKIIEAIDGAQREIIFENAYVVLPKSLKDALARASRRGVKIRAISNSIANSDQKLVAAGWERSRDFLVSIGAEVWEHIGKSPEPTPSQGSGSLRAYFRGSQDYGTNTAFLHAKTMVVDGERSYVMSYNFDPRSENLNMEVATHVKGTRFAKAVTSEIENNLKQAEYVLVASDGKLQLPKGSSKLSCVHRWLSRRLESQL
jgi:putative cardiolipin synthase